MNLYASKMVDMLNRTGEPTKTTSTVERRQGLDIGSLLMMLSMSDLFGTKGNKPNVSDPSEIMNPADIMGTMGEGGGFNLPLTPAPQEPGRYGNLTAGGDITPDLLMRLLSGFRGW